MIENERLKALEVQMKELLGNGQPGRIKNIEDQQAVHGRMIWIGFGVLLAMQFVAANGWLKIH